MGKRAARRAIGLVGTRFRLQGRDPAWGLDCVGLILLAHRLDAGLVRADYRLRGGDADEIDRSLSRWFRRLRRAAGREGDVLLLRCARDQLHLAVRVVDGFVHADARLGRVVRVPGEPRWPLLATYRRRAQPKLRGE